MTAAVAPWDNAIPPVHQDGGNHGDSTVPAPDAPTWSGFGVLAVAALVPRGVCGSRRLRPGHRPGGALGLGAVDRAPNAGLRR